MGDVLTIAVVVPTFQRPERLRGCLPGLAQQLDPADEVIVVVRESDRETRQVVQAFVNGRSDISGRCSLTGPVWWQRWSVGPRLLTPDVVAFTDDDAVPSRVDSCAPAGRRFLSPAVGVVGGRDIINGTGDANCCTVGRISRWGRMVGNHHRGIGPPRDVDVLKGVNMAARAEKALSLPLGFPGSGAQPHSEVAICLEAARRGWRVVYDPAITVRHFPADRGGWRRARAQ